MRLLLPLASVACLAIAACRHEPPESDRTPSDRKVEELAEEGTKERADEGYSESEFLDDLSNQVDFETIGDKIFDSSNAYMFGTVSFLGELSFNENPTHHYIIIHSLEGKELKFILYGEKDKDNRDYFEIIWPPDMKGRTIKIQEAFLRAVENDKGEQGVDDQAAPAVDSEAK